MTFPAALFYILAAAILGCTAMALTRRLLMHALVWMVLALLATALLYFLLGAPLLAGFQVIIYAGAIMVLFVFVMMLMRQEHDANRLAETVAALRLARRFIRPTILAILAIVAVMGCVSLLASDPAGMAELGLARAAPRELGAWIFAQDWPAVEIVSLLLLAALVGALFVGRPLADPAQPSETGDQAP